MSETVDLEEAIHNLSQLLERVQAGEEITLARAGRPIARIVPFQAPQEPRKPGIWKGRVWISPDFDEPMPDIEDAFGL
jgi:prevent-host-death family protein